MINKYHEFKASSDIYRTDTNRKEYLVKKSIESRISLDLRDILSVSDAFKQDGTIYKTKCVIYHIEMGKILLSHKYKEVKGIKEKYLKSISRAIVKGFIKRKI